MEGRFFSGIRFKIALAFFIVFLLISSITSLLLYLFIQKTITSSNREALFVETRSILSDIGFDPIQIPVTNDDQWILIWYESDLGAQEIYQKNGFPDFPLPFLNEENWPIDSLGSRMPVSFNLDSVSITLMQRQLFDSNEGSLNLALAKDNRQFFRQLTRVRSNMLWANLLAIFLSLILAYIVSGYSLRPVKAIIAKAKEIRAGPQMDRLPVGDSNDEIAQLSITMNQMIHRIEESILQQNNFFASAAHELRTPLANMQSELEYSMSRSRKGVDDASLDSIHDEVVRLKNVVQDFLLVSQLKTESLELRLHPARLDDVLYDVLEKLKPSLKKSGIEIKFDIEGTMHQIIMDVEKMESLIVNLIDNARNYGDNSHGIDIRLTADYSYQTLIIHNRIGKEVHGGNGLGLWVCKKIAELHDFEFITSDEQNTFSATLRLPISVRNSRH